jgi:hypothetical protein
VLICCEGEKTEPGYFRDLRRDRRISALVAVVPPDVGTDPKSVVECAVQKMADARRDKIPYTEVWCVFDMDGHAGVPEAFDRASARRISVAFSNPCFELWYLLHFEYSTAQRSGPQVRQRLRDEYIPAYEKSTRVYDNLACLQQRACAHAARLRRYHEELGQADTGNPSTGVDKLVDSLDRLARSVDTI